MDRIINGKQEGCESEFGQSDLEKGFVDRGRGEHSNDLFRWDLVRWAMMRDVE